MIYTYKNALSKYKTHFMVQKAVKEGKLVKVERGIYTSTSDISNFDYIVQKYPKVIFTMDSAFYFHGLTKKKPSKYHLATTRTALRMKDENIEQYYQIDKLFSVGATFMKEDSHTIKVYNKERMLIELIRSRNKMDPLYFEEIIHNYYLNKEKLDEKKLKKYIKCFKMRKFLTNRINEELEMDLE